MFIRRQDLIDRFDSNFRETTEGEVLFQPPYAEIGVLISWEEYSQAMAAFEKQQIINQIISWILFLAAGGFGMYKLLSEGRYSPFFIAVGLAFIISFSMSLRDFIGPIRPFIERRDEIEKALKKDG